MIFAIDFDGTIVSHDYPKIGKLMPLAKECINNLYKHGHKIIIWTCRSTKEDLNKMKLFLDENEIKYDKINENIEGIGFNPYPKVYADFYIDDRNFNFTMDWDIIISKIMELHHGIAKNSNNRV